MMKPFLYSDSIVYVSIGSGGHNFVCFFLNVEDSFVCESFEVNIVFLFGYRRKSVGSVRLNV